MPSIWGAAGVAAALQGALACARSPGVRAGMLVYSAACLLPALDPQLASNAAALRRASVAGLVLHNDLLRRLFSLLQSLLPLM